MQRAAYIARHARQTSGVTVLTIAANEILETVLEAQQKSRISRPETQHSVSRQHKRQHPIKNRTTSQYPTMLTDSCGSAFKSNSSAQ